MTKLITVEKAKKEIERLVKYVELAESYKADTLEKLIIKEYAYTNSIDKVIQNINQKGILKDGEIIEKEDVTKVLRGEANDELHQIIKKGYRRRIRHLLKS